MSTLSNISLLQDIKKKNNQFIYQMKRVVSPNGIDMILAGKCCWEVKRSQKNKKNEYYHISLGNSLNGDDIDFSYYPDEGVLVISTKDSNIKMMVEFLYAVVIIMNGIKEAYNYDIPPLYDYATY